LPKSPKFRLLCLGWMLNCLASCMRRDIQHLPADKDAGTIVHQSNIDRITAELGRQHGDAGETRRIKMLTQKRQSGKQKESSGFMLQSMGERELAIRTPAWHTISLRQIRHACPGLQMDRSAYAAAAKVVT
jgi:hypothetical protein